MGAPWRPRTPAPPRACAPLALPIQSPPLVGSRRAHEATRRRPFPAATRDPLGSDPYRPVAVDRSRDFRAAHRTDRLALSPPRGHRSPRAGFRTALGRATVADRADQAHGGVGDAVARVLHLPVVRLLAQSRGPLAGRGNAARAGSTSRRPSRSAGAL